MAWAVKRSAIKKREEVLRNFQKLFEARKLSLRMNLDILRYFFENMLKNETHGWQVCLLLSQG